MDRTADTMELAEATPDDIAEVSLRRVETSAPWLSAAGLLSAALLFTQCIITARALGVADFGVLAIVVGMVTLTRRLLSPRCTELVVKFVADALVDHDFAAAGATIKAAAFVEAVTAAVATGVVLALAPWAAATFTDSPDHAARFALYAWVIPFGLVTETSLGVLQAFGRFDMQVLAQSVERAAALAATGAALLVGGTLDAFVVAAAAGPIVHAAIVAALAASEAGRRVGERWLSAPLSALRGRRRKMIGYAIRSNVAGTLAMVPRDADILVIGWLRTPIEAGYYRLAWVLANLAMMPLLPLTQTVYPEAARLAIQQGWDELRLAVRGASRIAGAYVIVALLVAWLTGSQLLREIFGEQYVPASDALIALVFGVGFSAILFWARPVLLGLGLPLLTAFAIVVAVVVKVTGLLMFVPVFGFVASAWVLSGVSAVSVAILAWRVRYALGRYRRGGRASAPVQVVS